MSPLEYYRPKTLEEALALLERGVPLAGGTALTPRRYHLEAVIDLQDLGLDGLEVGETEVRVGAAVRLQRLVEEAGAPEVLRRACRQEAGWNLRNMATLGGAAASGDGRSPLLTVLLALDARLRLEPGSEEQALDAWLEARGKPPRRLITEIVLPRPEAAAYEQVARSPADRPLVAAALARHGDGWRVALGGYGERPVRVPQAEAALAMGDLSAAARAAGEAYRQAGDAWASAEYRSEVAAVLVRRLATEVGAG